MNDRGFLKIVEILNYSVPCNPDSLAEFSNVWLERYIASQNIKELVNLLSV